MPIQRDEVARILKEARDKGASEVHFKVPNRPLYRIDGSLLPSSHPELVPHDTHQIALALCGMAELELPLVAVTDQEFSFGMAGVGRFRVQLYRQRGTLAVVVQRMGLQAPPLLDFGFGPEVDRLIGAPGLVLVAGGRRRAALLASAISAYNARTRGHVVAIEDPIAFLHRDAMATIAQRGVGSDVPTFAAGIRSAVRSRADLLCVGDIPDRETAESMLRAAEDGIPTLAVVAAPTGALATSWISRLYEGEVARQVEERLHRMLKATLTVPDKAQATFERAGEPIRPPMSSAA